jgi:hypothetical protein
VKKTQREEKVKERKEKNGRDAKKQKNYRKREIKKEI